MRMVTTMAKTKSPLKSRSTRRLIFYIAVMAFPVAQFCIFYIGVNANALLLAFRKFDGGGYVFTGFDNIKSVFSAFSTDLFKTAAKNSGLAYLSGLLLSMPLGLLFAYQSYKKMPGHRVFKVVLFLPSVISSIVMAVIFRYFAELAIPTVLSKVFKVQGVQGLFGNPNTTFGTLIFYNIWVSFGVSMLMYLGAMTSVDESVVESAHLDGATGMTEFFRITLPMIYPTIVTFLVIGVAGFFTNQLGLFNFYGVRAEQRLITFGYYLYKETQTAALVDYPYLSAIGIVFTVIAVPVTLLLKFALEKFGPKAD